VSRPPKLRGFGAWMHDWIDLDAEGAMAWARAPYPGLPLLAVGHSLGGHAIGLCDGSRHLAGAALVSSAVAWIGYVPMRRLGMGEDLPGPAFRDWAHWIGQRH